MLGKTPKWALGGCWSFTHHVLVFNRQGRREASFSGMTSGSRVVLSLRLRYFQISLFFVSSSSPLTSSAYLNLLRQSFFPASSCFVQFFLNHKLIFWQFSAPLALIYFCSIGSLRSCFLFLGKCATRGCKVDTRGQECRCVCIFICRGNHMWPNSAGLCGVFDWRQRNIWINKTSCSINSNGPICSRIEAPKCFNLN